MKIKRILSAVLAVALLSVTFATCALASPTMAIVDTVSKNGTVHLRKTPHTGNNIIYVMRNGDILHYLGKSGNWFRVKHLNSGLSGYMYKSYMTKLNNFYSWSSWGALAHIKTKYSGSTVHLRTGPGTSYAIKGYLTTGDTLGILKKKGNWYYVQVLKSNKVGYVSKTYIANGAGGVTTVNVNQRKKASTSGTVIQVIPKGASVTVLNVGSKWSKVKYNGKTGFIWNGYLQIK